MLTLVVVVRFVCAVLSRDITLTQEELTVIETTGKNEARATHSANTRKPGSFAQTRAVNERGGARLHGLC